MIQEKLQKLKHWSNTIFIWLLIPVGALIANDIYDYAKESIDWAKADPAAAVEQKQEAEKLPEFPLLERFAKAVSQAPVAGPNGDGRNIPTPLIIAARNGNTRVVELLLQRGADVNVRDKEQGTTPVIAAAQQGHKETVDLLLQRGADVNARDASGKTALSEAIRNEHSEIVRLLKERGAN